jgi:hypothetical protein
MVKISPLKQDLLLRPLKIKTCNKTNKYIEDQKNTNFATKVFNFYEPEILKIQYNNSQELNLTLEKDLIESIAWTQDIYDEVQCKYYTHGKLPNYLTYE